MKANEIMVGDYFRIVRTGKIIKIVAVDEYSGSVDYFDGDAGGVLTIGVEKIEPIPLTKEILEKNGWKWNRYHTSLKLVVGTIHFGWGFYPNCISASDWAENGDCQITSLRCEYVHELQRALRCCGLFDKANDIVV